MRSLAQLRGQRVYIDSNFFIYFLTRHPTGFEASAAVLQACDRGEVLGMTGDAVVSELLVKPWQDGDAAALEGIRRLFAREHFIQRLAHDAACFEMAAELRGTRGGKLIDALHYATALRNGCRFLLSNDRDFKSDDHLTVLSLRDFVA
ncbi:MAG TPA: type II toxin-antitoxin system VapC family toxin [Rhodanobacteraceae bacterium]